MCRHTPGWLIASALAFLLAVPATAYAQQGAERDRAGALVGVFLTDMETTTRLDSDAGQGTDVDLEDDLGLKSSTTVGRIGGYYWFGRRHRIDVALFDLSRSATRMINRTIDFGDEVFVVDTLVTTESDLTILKTDYTFAAVSRDRAFLGVTAGLYVAETDLTLQEATVGRFESRNITAPLPLLGLRGDVDITDRITLRGAVQWLLVESGEFEGRFRDLYVGADYRFSRRMSIGLAYNDVSMNLRVDGGGFDGSLDWGYDGLLLYFNYGFKRRD
jgi:hypothetical protein